MRTIRLNIPDNIDLPDRDAKMMVASKLYQTGKLSLGQAADLVGLSKTTFMELLSDYDVPVFNLSSEDLDNDLKNAENYCL